MQTQTFAASSGAGGSLGLSNPPSTDFLDMPVAFNVPLGTRIPQGSVWCLDQTQPTTSPASNISLPYNAPFSPTIQVVVPPYSANAGATPKVIGVFQGQSFTTTAGALGTVAKLRVYGVGVVLAATEGGTAISVGTNLVASVTQYGAKPAAAALNSQIGPAIGYQINGTIALASTAGAGQVLVVNTPPGIIGVTTTTPLTFDTVASGVQEIATPSALAAGVNANQAGTIANAGSVTTITSTIGGIAATYTTTAADTATTAAVALVAAINASAAVSGPSPIILPATNIAGVITVRAINSGTAGNSITTVGAVSGGAVTFSYGAGTMASGTNSTITVTLANNHAAGTPYTGSQRTIAGQLLPNTGSALTEYLLNCYIQCC